MENWGKCFTVQKREPFFHTEVMISQLLPSLRGFGFVGKMSVLLKLLISTNEDHNLITESPAGFNKNRDHHNAKKGNEIMLNCCTANEANVGSQNIYDFFPSFLHNVCFKKAASWLACSYFQLGLILILRRLHIFQNNNWIKLQYFFAWGCQTFRVFCCF